MSKVFFDISMSLDGFVAGRDRTPDEPLGRGGERLHAWLLDGDERDREVLTAGIEGTGAVIAGRRTYDDSVRWWGANGPTGDARVPVFVLSHGAPDAVPEGGVYTFVDGVEGALDRARAAAGERGVTIMGGAQTGQQFLRAGHVDELSIHLVPVLLGGGTRMFDEVGDRPFDVVSALATAQAVHLRLQARDAQS